MNSLWFLSLVISVACALLATLLQQWARRYLEITQPPRCSPEEPARRRAFFADGVEKLHLPWVVEALPALLHLSLFLFFAGLLIFLFNVNETVFRSMMWSIGVFPTVYVSITLMPIFRHDSPYYAPLSGSAWFIYAGIRYLGFRIRWNFVDLSSPQNTDYFLYLRDRYRGWILGGLEKVAEETVSEQLSKIEARILDWTIGALDKDCRLETFFDLIPGFLNSKLVMNPRGNFNDELRCKFADALVGLLDRTLLSGSISDSAKSRRLINFMTVADLIPDFCNVSFSVYWILDRHLDQVPQSIETGNALAHWCSSEDDVIADAAHCIVANTLVNARERDDSWKALAKRVFCLPERVVGDYIAHEDNSVLLSILIFTTRKAFWSASWTSRILLALSKFNIHNTLPGLQHDFCSLWNEIARGVRKGTATFDAINVLRGVRHAYIALHRNTDAAPLAFIDSINHLPYERTLYPLCNIASHHRNSSAEGPHTPPLPCKSLSTSDIRPSVVPQVLLTPLVPTEVSGQLDQFSLSAGDISTPDDLTPDSRMEEISQAPPATPLTFPHLDPVLVIITPPDGSDLPSLSPLDPGNVPDALQHISSTLATSFPRLPESSKQRDIVAPYAASEISDIPSAGPTAASPPAPGFAASPPLEHVPHERRAELLALLRGTSTSCSTDSATLPILRVRGLVNRGNKCFAITVLQLLAHCPPFWNLFRQLGWLKAQERGGCSTPLVDATVRFLGEFVYEERPSPTQQSQRAVSGKLREEGEVYDVGPFEPTDLYDAMEKNQLDKMLVRSGSHTVPCCY